jgi:predicted transcriptional regulator
MDLGHLLTRSVRTLPEALGLISLQSKLKWKQPEINYNEKITTPDKDVT